MTPFMLLNPDNHPVQAKHYSVGSNVHPYRLNRFILRLLVPAEILIFAGPGIFEFKLVFLLNDF